MDRDPGMSCTPRRTGHDSLPESRAKGAGCSRPFAKAAAVLSVFVTLAGCSTMTDMAGSAESTVKGWIKPDQIHRIHLDRQRSVFVALPADAESPSDHYIGSGQSVARAVAEAFSRRGIPVEVAKKRLTDDEVLSWAARRNSGYVVVPVITRWDQQNTWLGQPSRLALYLSIIETASGKVVMAEPVQSSSLQPVSFVVESPDDLLERPLSRFVSRLY